MADGDQYDPWTQAPLDIGGQVHPLILQAIRDRVTGAAQSAVAPFAPAVQEAKSLATYPGQVWQRGTQGDIPSPEEMVPWAAQMGGYMTGAPGGEGGLGSGIRTFHASPYDFGSFDMSKVGTGQGAQAYGHGIYSAEAPEVAGEYLREFQGKNPALPQGRTYELELHGEPHEYLDWDRPIAEQPEMYKRLMTIPGLAKRRVTVDGLALGEHPDTQFIEPEVLNYFNRGMINRGGPGASRPEDVLNWMRGVKGSNNINRLDWKRHVDALDSALADKEIGTENFIPSHWHGAAIARGWEDMNPAQAASVMNRAGIKGVRYLDQESRENEIRRDQLNDLIDVVKKGQKNTGVTAGGQRLLDKYQTELDSLPAPTRNYVSFSDKLIDILNKYGWAGVIGGGGAMEGVRQKQPLSLDGGL